MRERGVKVLSLFFIDRVANYRDYDEAGKPAKGKFAEVFEAELAALAQRRRATRRWSGSSSRSERLHNGYFAQDKKGVLKDTREGRHAGRRRRLQPHHEGQGAAALRRRAAALHLQPLGAARRLGQPQRLPDLHAQRDAQRR